AERDADARRREHFAPTDRERRAERFLDPERDHVRLRLVAGGVQENGELVAPEPGERASRTQTRFETPRDRREQLVADQVSETVVDHLESIEVEIEHGESASPELFLELGEPPSQPLDEDRAVAEARQRIEEPGIAQALL